MGKVGKLGKMGDSMSFASGDPKQRTEKHVEDWQACPPGFFGHEKPQGVNFFLIPLGSKARKEKWPNYAILV